MSLTTASVASRIIPALSKKIPVRSRSLSPGRSSSPSSLSQTRSSSPSSHSSSKTRSSSPVRPSYSIIKSTQSQVLTTHYYIGKNPPRIDDPHKIDQIYENIFSTPSVFHQCIFLLQKMSKLVENLPDGENLSSNLKRPSETLESFQTQDLIRYEDLPDTFIGLKSSKKELISTYPYLLKKVGVHKLAILSSGIHDDSSKVLGYIGFLNILFLHYDIRINTLAPSVYTSSNKNLLAKLHNLYMALYDEVLNSFQTTTSWSKDTSPAYETLVAHSAKVDSHFDQPFFLGDAIVRFAKDISKLLLSLSNGHHAKMNIRREVEYYFKACEEEFENKIQGHKASFLKLTQEETIMSYLEIRRRNGAVSPCFEYVFLMHGLDVDVDNIPLKLKWDELRMLSIDHICIVNDLVSFPKEKAETNPHNLVLILSQYFNHDLEKGVSESKKYLEQLTTSFSNKKQAYFNQLKTILIDKVVLNPEDHIEKSLDSLVKHIQDRSISIKVGSQDDFSHIYNAYRSVFLMEQWADGHISWEHSMRSKRHDVSS